MVDLNWPIDNYSVNYVDKYNEVGLVGSDPYIDMELGIGWDKNGTIVHDRLKKLILYVDGMPIDIPNKNKYIYLSRYEL